MSRIIVDARGHRCPVPTLRLRRAVGESSPGDEVELIADDPMARIDAPHYAAEAGLELLSASTKDGVVQVVVRLPL